MLKRHFVRSSLIEGDANRAIDLDVTDAGQTQILRSHAAERNLLDRRWAESDAYNLPHQRDLYSLGMDQMPHFRSNSRLLFTVPYRGWSRRSKMPSNFAVKFNAGSEILGLSHHLLSSDAPSFFEIAAALQ